MISDFETNQAAAGGFGLNPKMSRRAILQAGALGTAALALPAPAETPIAALEALISAALRNGSVPGLALATIRDGRISFARGYGAADVARREPVTIRTAFHLASVTKIVTGTVLMQMWQQRLFDLDDPVQPHLDFPVVHPHFPGVPITFRQLFSHSSGISDAGYGSKPFSDPPLNRLSLRDFLSGYLVPGGKWYDRATSFTTTRPGQAFSYCNVGIALAGYLAERIGGGSLADQTNARIVRPLSLRQVAWSANAVRNAPVAVAYDRINGGLVAVPPARYPDAPAGMARVSLHDLARLIAIYTRRGTPILSPATVDTMLAEQPLVGLPDGTFLAQSLFWARYRIGDRDYIAHNGGDVGAYTLVAITPDRTSGFVILTNATANKAAERLFDELADIVAGTHAST